LVLQQTLARAERAEKQLSDEREKWQQEADQQAVIRDQQAQKHLEEVHQYKQKADQQLQAEAERAEKQLAEERCKYQQEADARANLDSRYECREREARRHLLAEITEERKVREELQSALEFTKAEHSSAVARAEHGEYQLSEERQALLEALEQQKKASEAVGWRPMTPCIMSEEALPYPGM